VKITIGNVELRVPREFAEFAEKAGRGEVKVTIYFGNALAPEERVGFYKAIDQFRRKYPGIEVKIIEYGGMGDLKGAVSASGALPPEQREAIIGSVPDVFTWAHDWIGGFADKGYIIALEDYIGVDAVEDVSEHLLPSAMAAVTYLGKTYGLPYAGEALALFVNTRLVSTPPTTFSELKKIMEQFYNPTAGTYGISGMVVGVYHINAWVTAHGGFFYDEVRRELGHLKPETSEGIKFFVLNILRYMDISDLGHDYQRRLFGTGKAPFYISGPWDVRYAIETLGLDGFTVVPLPSIDGKVPRPFSGYRNLYISVMATAGGKERTYASILFVLFLALDDNALMTLVDELGYVPVKLSVAETVQAKVAEKPLYKIVLGFYQQLARSVAMPKDINMEVVWGTDTYLQTIWKAYADALAAGKTPDEAVREAIALVDKALRDAYNEIAPKIKT
jgi:arabinogalactan oligomer/maltooligosaccharide transport system substrate-binding protein